MPIQFPDTSLPADAVRLSLLLEFDQDCGSEEANRNCQGLLDNVNADPDEAWWYWIVLVGLFVVFRIFAIIILKSKASKYF